MKYTLSLWFLLLVACNSIGKNNVASEELRPNILFIMLDDLGYSDLGCYGSEIRTPNIDQLAKHGTRYTNFKTASMCAPSRAMFLSGNYSTIVGHGRMIRPGKDDYLIGKKGYEREITDRVVTFPKLLQDAGYYNAIAGKWHMGYAPESDPSNQGFEDSWVLMEGYSNHYNNRGLGLIIKDTLTQFRKNGKSIDWPKDTFSTEHYTKQVLGYLDKANEKQKPFFIWASYTAPHWPLQVPEDWLHKYEGTYDEGYEVLRKKRFESLKSIGILPENAEFTPPMDNFPAWDTLSDEQKARESRKMELYAAMVENADYHIGRLIDRLKANAQYENTIIVLMSDNGASNTDLYNDPRGGYCRLHHDNSFENMGKPSSWVGHGISWANSMMSPKLGYKTWYSEGGISVPFIISGGYTQGNGNIRKELFEIRDLAPTFLEMTEVEYPEIYQGKPVAQPTGKSVLSLLKEGKSLTEEFQNRIFAAEERGHAYLRKGDWKIVNFGQASDTAQFKLYNLRDDLGERLDVSKENPSKKQELLHEWLTFKEETGILLN